MAVALALALILVATARAPAQERAEAEVALTFGVLAYVDGHHEEAAALFAEAVRLMPDSPVARQWLGLAWQRLGRTEEADRELAAARRLDAGMDTGAGQAGPSLLSADPEPLGAPPKVSGWASLAFGSDTNPLLFDDAVVVFPPGRDPLAGETADLVGRFDLQLDLRPGSGEGVWTPEIVLRGGQARYRDLDFLNAGSIEGRFQLARGRTADGLLRGGLGAARVPAGNSAVAFLVQVAAGRHFLGGEAWADTRAASAVFSVRTGGVGRFEADLLLRHVALADDPGEPFTTGGRVTTLALGQQFYLGRADSWLRVGGAAGVRDAGLAYHAGIRQIMVDLAVPLGEGWSLWIAGTAGREAFREDVSNPFGTGPREDLLRSATVVLARHLGQRVFLTGRASWLERRAEVATGFSDPVDLGYRRQLFTGGITWAFR